MIVQLTLNNLILAIYHLHSGFISRSSGRSSVQAAAYIAGEKLFEERREKLADYTQRASDIEIVNTLAPENSKYKDLSVWNEVERFEDEYAEKHYKTPETVGNYKESAQTASTIILALPNELSLETNTELLEKFINTRFTSRGLISTYAIHNNDGNLHAHIQTTRRAINEEGEFLDRKDRAICTKSSLIETRKLWADLANEYLEKEGVKDRITEKSFVDLGIDLDPSKHRGWFSDILGCESRISLQNEDISKLNMDRILNNPSIIIDLINATKATFTQKDILIELHKRLEDEIQVSQCFEKVLEGAKYIGESVKGEFLYTGEKYQKLESDTLSKFDMLSENKIEKEDVYDGVRELVLSENGQFGYLSSEQKSTVLGVTSNNQFSIVLGKAGAGKTSAMAAVSEIYKNQGRRVIGMSLSAVASENLGNDAKIESKTIASWTHDWRSYEIAKEKFLSFNEIIDNGVLKQIDWYKDLKRYEGSQLQKGDIIIVDEAGMVGTQNWNDILTVADRFGAKVIAVGDNNQFEAISSGDCFRKFVETSKDKSTIYELNEIRRQNINWMKSASTLFSKLNTIEGLTVYENHGNVKELVNRENAIKEAAEAYIKNEKIGTTTVLCYKKSTVHEINNEIRKIKKLEDIIGDDIALVNSRNFAENDKIMFLQNNKDLDVKNGVCGIILEGNHQFLKIRIDDDREITIDTKKYDKIDHAYAMTLHKSQGKTFDNVVVVAEKGMDAKATYVAMTRHKENVEMIYSRDQFSSFKSLTNELSKYRQKDLIADYENIQNDNKLRVFEYQNSLMETAAILKEINQGICSWKNYREAKDYSLLLGREIHKNYENHKLYLDQLGITKEKIEINLGLKNRPLSNVEINARDCVKLYAKTSEEARFLLKTMKVAKFNIKNHDMYETYCNIRDIRNDLAKEIISNYPLHRPFVTEVSREYFISQKTMENQVAYGEKMIQEQKLDRFYEILEIAKNNKAKIEYNWQTVFDKIDIAKNDTNFQQHMNEHKEKYGYPEHVNNAMVAAYCAMYGIDKSIRFRDITNEYASMLIQNKIEEQKLTGETQLNVIENAIKQAMCFEALKLADNNGGRELSEEKVRDLDIKAKILSDKLDHDQVHLLNNKELMIEANRSLVVDQNHNKNTINSVMVEKLVFLTQKEIERIDSTMSYKGVSRQQEFCNTKSSEIEI